MGRGPIRPRKLVNRSLLSPSVRKPRVVCCISPPFGRLSTTVGKVTHVLLTRAPLYRGRSPFSCDLHVLGAPLTFALSQDQTLQLIPHSGPCEPKLVNYPSRQSRLSGCCSITSSDSPHG